MYKVFINEKPLFFIQNLDELILSEGAGVKEYTDVKSLDEIFDFHEDNTYSVLIGDEVDWNNFVSLFKLIEAAGGLVQKEDSYLFIFRNGKWDLPKGKLEKEDADQAEGAIREVEEECGITNPILKSHLIDTYHTYFHKGAWVLKRTYWYLMSYAGNEETVPQTEEGITEVVWKSINEWPSVLENTYGSIQDVLDEYLASL